MSEILLQKVILLHIYAGLDKVGAYCRISDNHHNYQTLQPELIYNLLG
jgi:hypothetical protein